MSKILVALLLLVAVGAMAQTESVQLGAQSFEANDWQTEFTGTDWVGKVIRVSNTSYDGSYSVRWNQDDDNGRVDPITGAPGYGNSQLDWRGADRNFYTATPSGAYFRMAFRHDDYNNDATSSGSQRKLFYMVDQLMGVGGMYIKFQNGATRVQLSCCNAWSGGTYSTVNKWYHDNWGYSALILNGGPSPALDGQWHTFAVYWNYVERYMQFWMDETLLQPTDSGGDYAKNFPTLAAEKKVPYHPDWDYHTKGIQIMYYNADSDLVNGSDRSGYFAGIQVDALEFWDGIPDSTYVPPDPPTTITRPDSLKVE